MGKVLSDSERQRPDLGTRPNPKSRLQVLVSKLAPEKDLGAHLLWTLLQTVPYPNPTPVNQTTVTKTRSCKLLVCGPSGGGGFCFWAIRSNTAPKVAFSRTLPPLHLWCPTPD